LLIFQYTVRRAIFRATVNHYRSTGTPQ